MTRTLTPLTALTVTALIGLAAAGCKTTDTKAVTPSSPQTPRQKALAFAVCIRDNGVATFPDPDLSGSFGDALEGARTVDTNSSAWKQALGACKSLEPAGLLGPATVTSKARTLRLAFAQCVRDQGIKDFPDPADNQPLVDTNHIPSASSSAGMNNLKAAMRACHAAADAAIAAGR